MSTSADILNRVSEIEGEASVGPLTVTLDLDDFLWLCSSLREMVTRQGEDAKRLDWLNSVPSWFAIGSR